MRRFRFGIVDGLVNARPSPTALSRANYLTAATTGADSFWVGDHLNSLVPRSIATPEHLGVGAKLVPDVDAILEPWTTLGYFAARNRLRRLTLGMAVTDAVRRHPAITAQAAATLHLLNRGRTILGVGVGEREGTEPYGVSGDKPVARLEEAIAVIRTLWRSAGQLITRDSPYFPLRKAIFTLPPHRGTRPHIWVAAHGPRMLGITGRLGDGWLPFTLSRPADYGTALEGVHTAADDAGRDPLTITPAAVRAVVTGRSRDDVDEALNSTLVKTSALSAPATAWARHGARHPLGEDFSGVHDLVPQVIDEATALAYTRQVPVGLMREITFNGTPAEVIDQVAEWRDAGLRYLNVINGSVLNPRLRKGAAAALPFVKVLRGLRKL
ncbi:LLM class flavin-dependent oxidoreductase [Mycolicibacillus trivialis]